MYEPEKLNYFQVVKYQFKKKDVECIVVRIEDEEYRECEHASSSFWCNSKKGAYGKGLGATKYDEHKPVRTGLLGQMAFGKLTGLPVDTEYREGGDEQDNLIFRHKIDIKCSMSKRDESLIYHSSANGIKIPLDKDIYVCSYIQQEDRMNKSAIVVMTGFALKEDVEVCKVAMGKKGNGHLNYELPINTLRPIKKLIDCINKKLASQI